MEPSQSLVVAAPPAETRRRKHLALGLLALLALLLLLLFDWNWFKGPVERAVSASTGREFRIEGDLDVDLAPFRPTVIANGVVLGNADWGKGEQLFRAEQVRVQWAVWHLLRGVVRLPKVELARPVLALERDGKGRVNWAFDDQPRNDPLPTRYPSIGQLLVADGHLTLVEPGRDTELDVKVRSGEPPADGGLAPLLLIGDGRYRGSDFLLQGRIDSPVSLVAEAQPFRIDLEARAGSTIARARGGLETPLQLEDFDLDFDLSGDDMAQLYPLLGLALPETPPYALEGQLARAGTTWSYRDVQGKVGDSDLAGDISVDTGAVRNRLVADLVSQRLDFDDLAGFVGGTPHAGKVAATPGSRLFPDKPYDLSKLRAMDADVRLRARQVISPALPLEAMDAHLKLVDGDLHLNPFDFTAAGGEIAARIHLDARQTPIAADIRMQARRLELPKLFPEGAPESAGRIGGLVEIKGRGNSVAALMASADGEIGAGMGKGRISNLTLELAGLDIAEALKFLLGKDKVVPVRCGYADFAVKDGVMTSRAFAFDTTDTLLLAEGSINLGDETLDLVLNPRPKDRSPFSLRSPLNLRGTLKQPTIRPQAGPLALRGAVAAALYALAPPAAILALIETGPGEDADCSGSNVDGSQAAPDA